ncbi:tetratricopeptide repeat protein [Ottowia thiooxydans]
MTRFDRKTLFFSLLVVVAALCIYLPGLHHSLIFDDARLSDGSIFGKYGNLLELKPRMLSYGSFVWLQPLFGDAYTGQRVVNLLLHLATCVAIFMMLQELLRSVEFSANEVSDPGFEASKRAALLVGVGLFAVHPVASYAVGYLIQRSIVMAALFSALSCFAVARGFRTKKAAWFVYALLAYVLALMSKEHAIMVAGVWIAIYIFVARPKWQHTLAVSGIALTLLAVAVMVLMQRYGSMIGVAAFDGPSIGYVKLLEELKPGISSQVYSISVVNEMALFFYYGFLWLVPNVLWMSIDIRPHFPLSPTAFPQVLGALGFLILAGGSFWALLTRRDRWGFAALCALCAILLFGTELVTSWVQDPFVLYRSYLWALMLPGLVAIALVGRKSRTIYTCAIVAVLVFSALAWGRVQTFRNDFTLWSDAAEKIDLSAQPNAVGRWRSFLNRGAYFLETGEDQKALEDFTKAFKLGEPVGSAAFNAGMALRMLKRYPQALEALAKAESQGFTDAALYYQRAETLKSMGRFKDAYDNYSLALAKPQTDQVRQATLLQRAELALPAGQYASAIDDFKELLKLQPGSERYLVGLGIANVGAQKATEAMSIFNQLLASKPTAPALYGRALAHAALNDKPNALKDIDQAIALEPTNPGYRQMKSKLEAGTGAEPTPTATR